MRTESPKPAEKPPPRMAALAKLPVFFNLAGKRAVLAGATAAAAWKAELLAAAGADVEIYATELESEMAALIERGAAAGSLTHHARPWAVDIFSGAAIALADAETDEQAQAFYCAAVAAGVPVNVIDKPDFCQFQFGSIVNRSPVIVSISTDGAAPILGQAIRRRIESLLPPSLAAWGQLAKDIRDAASSRLSPGPQRRAFWERFSDRAFGNAPDATGRSSATALIEDIANGTQASMGRVSLIMAEAGDPELLTLKAVRALQSADVIVFDDLVSDEVLELARRESRRMRVGTQANGESLQPSAISDLMIKFATEGKHVVRLTSGDTANYGRAGEELDRLEKAGISVTVVPGTSTEISATNVSSDADTSRVSGNLRLSG